MKKIYFSLLITIMLCLFVGCQSASTAITTINIYTAKDLELLRNDFPANYVLKNDIDYEWYDFEPIMDFYGDIDGQGHVIKNIRFTGNGDYYGLIGTVKEREEGTLIRDIGIEGFTIHIIEDSNDLYVGPFGAFCYDIDLLNCYANGGVLITTSVASNSSIGSLLGSCQGTARLQNCYANVDIGCLSLMSNDKGNFYCGGLIGDAKTVYAENCYFGGGITCEIESKLNNLYIGGLIGKTESVFKVNNFINLSYNFYAVSQTDFVNPIIGCINEQTELGNNYYCIYNSDVASEKTHYNNKLIESNYNNAQYGINIQRNKMGSKEFLIGTNSCLSNNDMLEVTVNFDEKIWNVYDYVEGEMNFPTLKIFDLQ